MTYNNNVICSLGPLLWWSVWSRFTIRALVPLYHPGTLLYAAREALLSSYPQGDMCSLWLPKGKSFRKWDVHLSSHRVTISITNMTHLHNCPKSNVFPQWPSSPASIQWTQIFHWGSSFFFFPGSNPHFNTKSRPCHTFCSLDSFMNVFALVRFNSGPFSLILQNDQKCFLYISSKNQRAPEWGLKDIL